MILRHFCRPSAQTKTEIILTRKHHSQNDFGALGKTKALVKNLIEISPRLLQISETCFFSSISQLDVNIPTFTWIMSSTQPMVKTLKFLPDAHR